MDYKNTLNLPKTDFPMKADLVLREPQRLEKWQAADLYDTIRAARAGAEKFVLHDGPPFANGDVHIGTALNKILKDIIIKYKSLRGFDAPYVPGWDCHGLPIEFKVSQEMRKAGNTAADPATIRTACEAYARKYIDIQRTQFKRLGVLGDWANPYLTLNKEYEADELRLFADLVEQGFVYRGKKPVYWSIPCRTALAEAEVEYADHVSQSVYVRYRLQGEPNTYVIIWTTTPWTLPANLAVAFNPSFFYSYVQADDATYLVCDALLEAVSKKCGWSSYQITRTASADELATLVYEHPFCPRTGHFFPAGFVENSTGTGFVHIAPGHGMEDYQLGRQVGLPIYSPVDDNGCLTPTDDLPREQQLPAEMVGKSILEKHGQSDANNAVLHELRVRTALLHQENYHHSYPHCWRSKTPVIFRAMDQWFIKIDHEHGGKTFRETALAEIDRVHWIPDWGKNRIEGAVKTRPDWCISRQRSWGVPIPAFYDASGNPLLDARIVRSVAALIEQHGSNVWFEKNAAELWALVQPAGWTGPAAVAKSADTLDVWIDSGSSSRAVLMRRTELQHTVGRVVLSAPQASAKDRGGEDTAPCLWQADVYLEGSDQHRGWFQSSLLLSLAGNGAAPFKTVLTHGFMVKASKIDPKQKEKVSKSAQSTYEKPETADRYVNQFGADVVRLWVASQDYRGDIWVGDDRIEKVAETYRLLRNTLRYQLSNLYDFDPAKHSVADAELTGLDRWILGRFAELEVDIIKAYDAYEFHVVYQRLSQFAAVELSSMYHDAVKDRLYTDPANSPRRRSTQTALHRLVIGLSQMLAPLLAFTADEAWDFIPGKPAPSVHASTWQPRPFPRSAAEQSAWEGLFLLRVQVLPHLEKARQAKEIGKALDAQAILNGSGPLFTDGKTHAEALRELLNISQLEIHTNANGDADATSTVILKAAGQKCERCWHWELAVGLTPAHPTLCPRCVEAVSASPA
ncbi:isoleucine--tRNA ligase [Verrucomicrobiota bacterium]|nr:isoleucine--tRNA ligase [Verrucomicrobiota bacterium]